MVHHESASRCKSKLLCISLYLGNDHALKLFLKDPNGSSRWENVRSLLSDMLKATEKDFENKTELNAAPNPLERTRAALAYIIRLLEEDLLCWVRLLKKDDNDASGPASLLRKKIDVPLMARLLWPQSDIGHISLQCRELIALHISGLVMSFNS